MNSANSFLTQCGEFYIVQNSELSSHEFQDIESLIRDCKISDGTKPKIYWEFLQISRKYPANFLVYCKNFDKQILVGYFSYFLFENNQTEILGFVHPKYRRCRIFSYLFQLISKILKNFGITNCFLVIPYKNQMAKDCAKALGGVFSYYEYHMQRIVSIHEEIPENLLSIQRATVEHIPCIANIDHQCFYTDYSLALQRYKQIIAYTNREIWMCYLDDVCIANAHITFEQNNASVHNIGVLPEYRNRGYATILLKNVINHLVDLKTLDKITLDVSSENTNALNIYKKCGFSVAEMYEYWTVLLNT